MSVSQFLDKNFLHFNARELVEAARGYKEQLASGNKMLLALAGAMSTAELGISLAEMIRSDAVHAISCTAANFEEDLFNLFAHDEYKLVPHYRDLSPDDEVVLRDQGFNRVTDTCIPESCFRAVEGRLIERWREADQRGERRFATEYFAEILREPDVQSKMQVSPQNSWVLAALEKEIPVFTPGFEDSTMGNIFAARVIDGTLSTHDIIRSGTEQMQRLVDWYLDATESGSVGFFQIGGGIAGDFAICAVPLILQDLLKDAPLWSYFAQISDSTTSYGSYSGAVPNEKITWYKLDRNAPKFMINSDASICAPLIFAYILGM